MNDDTKVITSAKSALKLYGIDAADYAVNIIDRGSDNVFLVASNGTAIYCVAAGDYLSDDEIYYAQAKQIGIVRLAPIKLLKAGLDGDYVTMFDHLMICKVYECVRPLNS